MDVEKFVESGFVPVHTYVEEEEDDMKKVIEDRFIFNLLNHQFIKRTI